MADGKKEGAEVSAQYDKPNKKTVENEIPPIEDDGADMPGQPSLKDLLGTLKAILAGKDKFDESKAVEAVAGVVESLKQDPIVQAVVRAWDKKPQSEQIRTASDYTLLVKFLVSIAPGGPLVTMPREVQASLFRAFLYYGILTFNSKESGAEGQFEKVGHDENEALVKQVIKGVKTSETVGLALARGAAYLAGASELGEIVAILVNLFERNRKLAGGVREHLHRQIMAELKAAKDRSATAAAAYKKQMSPEAE